jgi:hypothetical protein
LVVPQVFCCVLDNDHLNVTFITRMTFRGHWNDDFFLFLCGHIDYVLSLITRYIVRASNGHPFYAALNKHTFYIASKEYILHVLWSFFWGCLLSMVLYIIHWLSICILYVGECFVSLTRVSTFSQTYSLFD